MQPIPTPPDLAPIFTDDVSIPPPPTPPPPTPTNIADSPVPPSIGSELTSLIEEIHSGNSPADSGLRVAQLLHPFHSSTTPPLTSPAIAPYVRAMFTGRQRFEALQNGTVSISA